MNIESITAAANDWLAAVKAAQAGFKKMEEDYTPEALNAAAATILIHATKISPSNGHSNGHAKTQAEPDPFEYEQPVCKFCSGEMWDNRRDKRNPRGPDYKCKDQACGGAAWIDKKAGGLSWKQ